MTSRRRKGAEPARERPPSSIRRRVRAMRERFVFQREMRLRLISAAILIPAVLVLTYVHELSFGLVVLVTGALVLYEWLRMIGAGHMKPLRWVGWLGLALVAGVAFTQPPAVAIAAILASVLAAAIVVWGSRLDVALRWVAAGIVYAGLAIVSLIELRKGTDGFGAVIFVFLVSWATDTAAFLVGRLVGGPRLWRRVSPSKTWSGAIGGLVAGTAFGAIVAISLDVPPSGWVILAAAVVAVAAQVGDLLESAAKRRFSVKDTGTIIPGHGGVMDRVDGLIVASFATLLLGSLVGDGTASSGLLAFMGR